VNGHRRWGDRASFNSDLRGSLTVTGI
jgi:hypothetical protein